MAPISYPGCGKPSASGTLIGFVSDFVVIGAGSAGCVVAAELSSRYSVTLVESGGSDRSPEVVIPAAFSKLFDSERDWGYRSVPEPYAAMRPVYVPRGRMLGGSSAMNAMIYMRGRPSDFDEWESQTGAAHWGWSNVLDVFRNMELNATKSGELHGQNGPLRVSDQRDPNFLTQAFVESAAAAGYSRNDDFNGPTQDGVGLFQVTQRRGRRWSAADAFLRPAMKSSNLRLLTNVTATRVLFDQGAAVGVEVVDSHGEIRIIPAAREVILCAGTIGSPHLLQLSGIGDPDHLKSIGVPVMASSPEVGQNLQDHPACGLLIGTRSRGTLDEAEKMRHLLRWLLVGRGPLTSPVAEGGLFARSEPGIQHPDLEFHFAPATFDDHGRVRHETNAFTLGPVLIDPESRGSVLADTAAPDVPPSIRFNLLSSDDDVRRLVAGMRIARAIVSKPPLSEHVSHEIMPGETADDDESLERFVREHVELLYHPVGTCRMGADSGSVVDPDLRVRGVGALRVIDASVMPKITSGNTNAPTMMIGAVGARRIFGP